MLVVSDADVCWVVAKMDPEKTGVTAVQLLMEWAGVPKKRAIYLLERATDRDYIEYGTSVNYPWLTEKGKQAIAVRSGT